MEIDDLIGELNRIRPIRGTVYVSGLPEDDLQIQKLLRNQNATYLRKPLDFESLVSTIYESAREAGASAERQA